MLLPRTERLTLTTPDGATLHGLRAGRGPVPLLFVPGTSDGVASAGQAPTLLRTRLASRGLTYSVLYLSRRDPLPAGNSVEQQARDYLWALEQLGWGPGIVEANGAGGPIGQLIAARRPDLVRGLVLSSTLHRTLPETRAVLERWLELLDQDRYSDFRLDCIERTYRPWVSRLARPARRLLALHRPTDPERLKVILRTLLDLDQRAVLPGIRCPTLVVGGAEDRLIPGAVQREMAELIPNARLLLYPGYGHANDQENPHYLRQLDRFALAAWDGPAAQRLRRSRAARGWPNEPAR